MGCCEKSLSWRHRGASSFCLSVTRTHTDLHTWASNKGEVSPTSSLPSQNQQAKENKEKDLLPVSLESLGTCFRFSTKSQVAANYPEPCDWEREALPQVRDVRELGKLGPGFPGKAFNNKRGGTRVGLVAQSQICRDSVNLEGMTSEGRHLNHRCFEDAGMKGLGRYNYRRCRSLRGLQEPKSPSAEICCGGPQRALLKGAVPQGWALRSLHSSCWLDGSSIPSASPAQAVQPLRSQLPALQLPAPQKAAGPSLTWNSWEDRQEDAVGVSGLGCREECGEQARGRRGGEGGSPSPWQHFPGSSDPFSVTQPRTAPESWPQTSVA